MKTYIKIVKKEKKMNLKDYSKKNINDKDRKNKINDERLNNINKNYGSLVDEFMKRYGKMDEKQMMDEMFLLINQKKKEGSFNLDQIKEAAQNIKPFLNEDQKQYMQELLSKID